jgi:hypothetical protein
VSGEARVLDRAHIYGDAVISGTALVYSNLDWVCLAPLGITAWLTEGDPGYYYKSYAIPQPMHDAAKAFITEYFKGREAIGGWVY